MNPSIESVFPIIQRLDDFVKSPEFSKLLKDARAKLNTVASDGPFKIVRITLSADAPAEIKSCRLVLMLASQKGPQEKHANSQQFLYSIEGSGTTRVKEKDTWRDDTYGEGNELSDRWHFVEVDTWHQSIPPNDRDWLLLAFHSAYPVMDEFVWQ